MNPRIRAKAVIIDKCKTMQSATVPLFLTFENADPLGDEVRIIFKIGDDLRQVCVFFYLFIHVESV